MDLADDPIEASITVRVAVLSCLSDCTQVFDWRDPML